MIRLFYPLTEIPGYRLIHAHGEGEHCALDLHGQGRGCRYLPTRLTRLRQRARSTFRLYL